MEQLSFYSIWQPSMNNYNSADNNLYKNVEKLQRHLPWR